MIKGNHFFLKANDSVLNVINNIENSQYQICFIVDDQGSLIGSITDGDIRRGLIEGYAIESHASKIMNSKGRGLGRGGEISDLAGGPADDGKRFTSDGSFVLYARAFV